MKLKRDIKQYKSFEELPALLSTAEVAQLMKCSQVAVWKWIEAGKIKGVRKGRSWYIDKNSIREYVKIDKEKIK